MLNVSPLRAAFAAGCVLPLLAPCPACADFHIYSPYEIDLGELEIEHNGDAQFDRYATKDGAQSYTLELGTGLTPWWHSEIADDHSPEHWRCEGRRDIVARASRRWKRLLTEYIARRKRVTPDEWL